jgi:hypothetical protein
MDRRISVGAPEDGLNGFYEPRASRLISSVAIYPISGIHAEMQRQRQVDSLSADRPESTDTIL